MRVAVVLAVIGMMMNETPLNVPVPSNVSYSPAGAL
jgi:hypothetical protein